jgi:bifunctional oligoribonuclease and PAP phosphatase NrnA
MTAETSSTGMKSHRLEEIARYIESKDSFILLPHVSIDGDDLGSLLAMKVGLEKLGKRATFVCHERVPLIFDFMPRIEEVSTSIPREHFDCAVLVECTNLGRLPEGLDIRKVADRIINIDHHPRNDFYGDFNYVDCGAAAVGEIIYELLRILGVPLDRTIAMALYVAMLTDTGGFQFSNTSARTHRIVAELMEYSIDADEISRHVFRTMDFNVLKLKGKVIQSLRQEFGGKLTWGVITPSLLEEFGVHDEDIQQFIEDLNVVRGSQIFALLKETKDGKVRVSLRSSTLPVNEVAIRYHGGGHVLAAGCTLEGSLDEARTEIVEALRILLEKGHYMSPVGESS